MPIPEVMRNRLSVPVVAAPLFIISNPKLVIEECKAGVVGSFPSLNARAPGQFEEWLKQINAELDTYNEANHNNLAAHFAVNLIVHKYNPRLQEDLELCEKYDVQIVTTSLGANEDVNKAVHSYGGIILHDVINNRFAKKAISKGADGLIAVATGAGGHAGTLSPFALIQELRAWFDGPILLSGCIASGDAVLAAQAMGADLGYIGSPFIATDEADAKDAYKQAIVDYGADDIVYTNLFTGVHGNYLKPSIENAGLDPDNLPESDPKAMNFGSGGNTDKKAWVDIWGCGQGIGVVDKRGPVRDYIERLGNEYKAAMDRLVTANH